MSRYHNRETFVFLATILFMFTFQGPTPLRLGPIESVPNIIADLIGSGRKKTFWLLRNFWPESGSTLAIMENVKWNESLIEKLSFKDEILSILKCYCLMWNVNLNVKKVSCDPAWLTFFHYSCPAPLPHLKGQLWPRVSNEKCQVRSNPSLKHEARRWEHPKM